MLQQPTPEDFVIATGESHSVEEFLNLSAEFLEMDWRKVVELDPRYLRPTEVDHLLGDGTKALTKLGWRPKVTFQNLVRLMVDHDLELARQEQTLTRAGHHFKPRGVSHG